MFFSSVNINTHTQNRYFLCVQDNFRYFQNVLQWHKSNPCEIYFLKAKIRGKDLDNIKISLLRCEKTSFNAESVNENQYLKYTLYYDVVFEIFSYHSNMRFISNNSLLIFKDFSIYSYAKVVSLLIPIKYRYTDLIKISHNHINQWTRNHRFSTETGRWNIIEKKLKWKVQCVI